MADHPDGPDAPGTPPQAAGDKPASQAPGEPLKAEVSRTDSPSAGQSAAAAPGPRTEPPAPKPDNPTAATTAATSEISSATGQVTPPAAEQPKPVASAKPAPSAAAKPAAPAPKPATKPAAPAGEAHVPKAAAPVGPPDPPPSADLAVPTFVTALQAALPGAVSLVSYWVGDWTIVVPVASLLTVLRYLRDEPTTWFDSCSDVTATDWPLRPERFDIVYCLYSTRHRHRLRVKARVAETEPVPSVVEIWPAANWLEREVYDMFGVNLIGHPDRRRMLMPEDWQGFPQRKDYPLEGPGELLMENPLDWLKLRQARDEADIE